MNPGPAIEVLPAGEFTERAARRIAGLLQEAVRGGGGGRVALAGGSTPKPVYALLGGKPLRTTIPWLGLSWWFGDERCVPPDHPDSNVRMAQAALFDPAGVPDTRIHRPDGGREDREAAARDYEKTLPEALELLILGIGDDGHTASLFPGSPAVAETRRRVVAAESPAGARWRLTITRPVIAAARRIVVLAAGAAKAAAVARALEGPRDPASTPAQLAAREGALWILDDAAASRMCRPENPGNTGGGITR